MRWEAFRFHKLLQPDVVGVGFALHVLAVVVGVTVSVHGLRKAVSKEQ